ncbi:hypothetical protein [Streptomyces sp. Inha503]|uniref:hypothetical protein n=1 Tax=Streptomyces sp. Inha503 TaxID=3383314 RepID=UPI0039A14316
MTVGYQHKPKNITLRFEGDSEYAGFECTVRGMTLGEYMEAIGIDEVTTSAISDMLAKFAASLISWNLEDPETGEPIPATPEAVMRQDKDFMVHVATEWTTALYGVSGPLEQTSPDGEPSVAASIPMDALSESLAS